MSHRVVKAIACLVIGTAIAACAAPPRIISTDPTLVHIGTEPEGYPRTFVREEGGTCIEVTEEWRSSGNVIWVKNSREVTITCPGLTDAYHHEATELIDRNYGTMQVLHL